MQINKFFYGTPVSHDKFLNRIEEISRIISRLNADGQSTAIIGDPCIGKTSLLNYIANPGVRAELYGSDAVRWYFSLIDVHMLGTQCTPARFWEYAISPVKDEIKTDAVRSALTEQYQNCYDNGFDNFSLEKLFSVLKKAGQRFILMMDEFDALLHHPNLNTTEFYGGLRALASHSEGAFALVIASRTSLARLNTLTQELSPIGSPFFNIFSEITLGPFHKKDADTLLNLAHNRFTDKDRDAIRALAGNHPYLLQAAASAMWDAYEKGTEQAEERRLYVTKRMYREMDHFFSDTWRVWSPEMRKAFSAVAIAHQSYLMPETQFITSEFLEGVSNWGPELEDLKEKGLITADERFEGGYRVTAEIMLTWLADELVKAVRMKKSFETWLQDKHIDGAFLSANEKEIFKKAIRGAADALNKGAVSIIESFGKGVGSGLGKM